MFGKMIASGFEDFDSSARGPVGVFDSTGPNVGEEREMPALLVVEAIGGLAVQRLRWDSRVARCWNGTLDAKLFSSSA